MTKSAQSSICADPTELRAMLARGQTPAQLRAESMDAEELRIHQLWHAGNRCPSINRIKTAVFTGGQLIWSAQDTATAARLIQATAAGYTINDAMPYYLDFPLPSKEQDIDKHERFFVLVLIGPRVGFTRRRRGGGFAFTPDLEN